MNLADTCVRAVPVPTLVLFELRRWALRELGDDEADRVVAATRNAHIVPLGEPTALLAAELTVRHKLPAIDALIYATALHHGATLVTCDAHFESLPGVEYRTKLAA